MVNKDIDTSMAAEGPTMAETSYLSLVQAQASITDAKESILFNNFFDLPPVLRLVSCCGPLAHLNFAKESLDNVLGAVNGELINSVLQRYNVLL